MPLGDSITAGTIGSSDDAGYRLSLYSSLTGFGYTVDFVGSQTDGNPNDFDPDHEGHPGFSDGDVADKVYGWLTGNPADIVLLHIGTNALNSIPDDVETILDEIDAFDPDTWVVLALIINRACASDPDPCSGAQITMDFNNNVKDMALDRVNNPANPAFPDKIIVVDMEDGAGINYLLQPVGDMWDDLHPYDSGYVKMADKWFSAIQRIPLEPGQPTLISPSGATSNPPPWYWWYQASGATYYHLLVLNASDTPVIQKWYTAEQANCNGNWCWVTDNTATLASGAHTWWIVAWNSNGLGPWSSEMSFSVP